MFINDNGAGTTGSPVYPKNLVALLRDPVYPKNLVAFDF
jgi:hypothetical protein